MVIPAAMFIEMAASALPGVPPDAADAQRKELQSFGDTRAQRIGASGLSSDFVRGYELGLQTARAYLAGVPAVVEGRLDF